MRRYRVWLLAAALCLAIAVPASAWEFVMDGAFTWEWDYRSQGGKSGFFGPYDQDVGSGIAGAPVGFFAPLNAWLGEQMNNFVSGSDAQFGVFYMSTNMDIRINPAIRIRGNYYIGEWAPSSAVDFNPNLDFTLGNTVASQAMNNRWGGIQRSFSPGYWNMLWMTVQLPWGEVALGKRKSVFGMGMYNNGEENRSSEKLALAVPYGPLRFFFGIDVGRRATTANNYVVFPSAVVPPDNTAGYYNQDFDKNNSRLDISYPQLVYRNGPLEAGIYFNPIYWTQGGEGILNTPAVRQTTTFQSEHAEVYGVAYTKYNNGRFFFNAELDWDHQTNRNRARLAGGAPNFAASRDTYVENWRTAAEGGVFCGPAKLSLLYGWAAGPDRRGGAQIDRTGLITQAGRTNNNLKRGSGFSNTGLYRPYSLLMVYSYGLGTHINADTGNGYVEDASTYGARLDYAVAANLNVFTSFFWADRVSQSGWGWGFIKPVRPTAFTLPASQGGATVIPAGALVGPFIDTARVGAPSIPDTNLGYEFGAGFDWKLLEGLTVNFASAYWQPGQWFAWACVDKTVPNWATTTGVGTNNPALWGINPNKQIDPIFGIELKITGDF